MAAALASLHNPFSLLGLPLRFRTDRSRLQERFYALSRELHPDRFVTDLPEVRAAALEQMSAINSAYQLLQSPERVRAWILEHFQISAPKILPTEWAERWFETQELLAEEGTAAQATLSKLLGDLDSEMNRRRARISDLEGLADGIWSESNEEFVPPQLQEIAALESMMSYLISLRRDVSRAGGRFGH